MLGFSPKRFRLASNLIAACASAGSVGLICFSRPGGRPRGRVRDFTQLFNCEKLLQRESTRGTQDVVCRGDTPTKVLWNAGIVGERQRNATKSLNDSRSRLTIGSKLVAPPTGFEP